MRFPTQFSRLTKLEALDVMNGEFTCCRLGHPHGDPCDREALMLPLLGLYADIYAERHGKQAEAYAFIEPVKSSLFPETFEYVHKGLDGVETTTTQVLFGDSSRPWRRVLTRAPSTSLPVPRTSSLGPMHSGTDSTTSTSTAGPVRGSRT